MSLEISLGKRKETIELIEQDGNKLKILIGNTEYELNVVKTSKGTYSILHEGNSYDIAVVREKNHKNYIVNLEAHSYNVEIIDAETKFQKLKQKDDMDNGDNTIISPMPGKIVKILVKEGQKLEAGDTAIIISAMKMESEFKAKRKGVVTKINVKEGDIVEGGKKLIVIK
ncbi:MAG: hypothetical protein K9J13_17350 [Saprospiraceae bacterium]|nr:hypothetical protein [Saprospiraceae bacterium]